MCRRSKDDPLAKFFFNRYHLHLLAIPREGAAVGDCYIVTPKGILSPGPIGALMLHGFKMPDIARDELIAGLSNQVSDAVDLDAGFHLLGPFLAATGLGSVVGDAKASMQSKGARRLSFRLLDARRDSVSPPALGNALTGRRFDWNHPLIRPENKYLITIGVIRTPSLTVVAVDDKGAKVAIGAEAVGGGGSANIAITSGSAGEITVNGGKPLAIAVELVELGYDPQRDSFGIDAIERYQPVRGGGDPPRFPEPLAEELMLEATDWRE
jgi:hypothetical protein